jgi:hypothetical protein
MTRDGRRILKDPEARSANPSPPAFLARPEGSPVYHGFPILEESMTDGWRIGAITDFEDPSGCEGGDAFVIAPDGSRAGLVWDVGTEPLVEISPPEPDRWGVYQVFFPSAVRTRADFIAGFQAILPALKAVFARTRAAG